MPASAHVKHSQHLHVSNVVPPPATTAQATAAATAPAAAAAAANAAIIVDEPTDEGSDEDDTGMMEDDDDGPIVPAGVQREALDMIHPAILTCTAVQHQRNSCLCVYVRVGQQAWLEPFATRLL